MGDVVKNVISSLKKREKEELNVFTAWEKAVGKKAAKHSKPALLKAKKLIVNVTDSTWLYKLSLEKGKLLCKFNDGLESRKKAKEIRFRIGKVK